MNQLEYFEQVHHLLASGEPKKNLLQAAPRHTGLLANFLRSPEGNHFSLLNNSHTVAHLLGNPRFELVRHDVVEPILVEVDQIYNLACPASPVHYQHNAVKTVKANVLGALHVLGIAKRVGARVLQASTSEVHRPRRL